MCHDSKADLFLCENLNRKTCPMDPKLLRSALSRYATGVTIVTANMADVQVGVTVNSFTSVSLEPPLLLFCLHNQSQALPVFKGCETFVINILSAQQKEISAAFAVRGQTPERWQRGIWAPNLTLEGALAHFIAKPYAFYDGGDHTIIVGQILSFNTASLDGNPPAEPLLYWASAYQQLKN